MKTARAEDGPPDFEDMRREARAACEGPELQEVLDAIQDLETRWARELARERALMRGGNAIGTKGVLIGMALILLFAAAFLVWMFFAPRGGA